MAQFLKDVLKPGEYHPRGQRAVRFTAADVQAMEKRIKEMAAAGLQIPVAWNHQPHAKPMSAEDILAGKVRNIIGHAQDARLDGGTLSTALDVSDDSDAAALKKAKYVSPEVVWDYKDGTGRIWPGPSITHIAVTGWPTDPHQQPFIQLSQDAGLQCVRLSMEDIVADDADNKKPPKKGEDDSGEGGDLANVKAALSEAFGMTIPDEVQDWNGLVIAIRAGGKPADDGLGAEPPMEPVTDAGPPPVMMSMDVQQELLNFRREDRKRRVRELFKSGRIDRPAALRLLGELDTVQMSMDGKPTGADAEIAAYEKLAPRPWKGGAVQMSQDTITEAPGGPAALSDEDRAARDEAKKTAERYSTAK